MIDITKYASNHSLYIMQKMPLNTRAQCFDCVMISFLCSMPFSLGLGHEIMLCALCLAILLYQGTCEHGYVLLLLVYCSLWQTPLPIFFKYVHWYWANHMISWCQRRNPAEWRYNRPVLNHQKTANQAQTILGMNYFCPTTFSTKHFRPKYIICGRRAQVITSSSSSLLYCCEIITHAGRDELIPSSGATRFQCGEFHRLDSRSPPKNQTTVKPLIYDTP